MKFLVQEKSQSQRIDEESSRDCETEIKLSEKKREGLDVLLIVPIETLAAVAVWRQLSEVAAVVAVEKTGGSNKMERLWW